ncbi:MAG: hypothetical protein AB8H03_12225 [Saprospiraceae bacterium]
MKNLLLLLIIFQIITSCSKEVKDPILDIKLEMSESNIYQSAKVSISDFSLINPEGVGFGSSIIQQWDGIEIEQDLTNAQSHQILIDTHWELELVGVKPFFYISITDNNEVKNIDIPYIALVAIDNSTELLSNEEYEIVINIETDSAFVKDNQYISLDWDFVTATIRKK